MARDYGRGVRGVRVARDEARRVSDARDGRRDGGLGRRVGAGPPVAGHADSGAHGGAGAAAARHIAQGAPRPVPARGHAPRRRQRVARRHARELFGSARVRRRRRTRRRPRRLPFRGPRREHGARRDRRELRHRRLRKVRALQPRHPLRQGRPRGHPPRRDRQVQSEEHRRQPVQGRSARRRPDGRQPPVAPRLARAGLLEAARLLGGPPHLFPQPQDAGRDREDARGRPEDRADSGRGAHAPGHRRGQDHGEGRRGLHPQAPARDEPGRVLGRRAGSQRHGRKGPRALRRRPTR